MLDGNIRLINAFTVISFSGRALWSQSVLSNFVYLQSGDPSTVGYLTGLMGSAQVLSSIPSGILADVVPKSRLLAVASLVGLVAIALNVYAVQIGSMALLAVALSPQQKERCSLL